MQLSPDAFNDLLSGLGQQFAWRKAFACPCISPQSGQPKPNCKHCQGKGRYWDATAVTGMSGVVGREQAKRQAVFGQWDAGDLMLSIPSDSPLYAMGPCDRVAALNRTEPFSINLMHGINTAIRFAVTAIDSVTWLDSNDELVNGEIPDISGSGELVWGSSPPPAKTTFALTGRRIPEYFCYQDLPLDRPHHAGAALPRRVQLRRFDLFGQ